MHQSPVTNGNTDTHSMTVILETDFISPVSYSTTTLCLKNDTDVAHYNFNAHQTIYFGNFWKKYC